MYSLNKKNKTKNSNSFVKKEVFIPKTFVFDATNFNFCVNN